MDCLAPGHLHYANCGQKRRIEQYQSQLYCAVRVQSLLLIALVFVADY